MDTPSVHRNTLISWVNSTLETHKYRDYSPIGLQVEGAPNITKIALGVSASLELIEHAAAWGAQAILVHHGFFWKGEPTIFKGWRKNRLHALFNHNITLASYHLPLDGHPTLGNNALLADLINLPKDDREFFGRAGGQPIALLGRYTTPQPASDILHILKANFHPNPIAFMHGPELVSTVGIVTGGGGSYFEEARDLGCQLFITGEPREPSMNEARETESHFIAAGHYYTETIGIRALGEAITQEFSVETKFFDFPNPV